MKENNLKKINSQSVIRGFCAFMILLTHISAFTKPDNILRVFTPYGYLWVGIFFFYTGLNITNSYLNNNKFFDKFWLKKLIRIYIPFVLSNILMVLVNIFLNFKVYGWKDIIKYIIGIKVINEVNWYIYAVLIFYLCAWFIFLIISRFKNIKHNKVFVSFGLFSIFVIYAILYNKVGLNLHLTTSIRNVYPVTLYLGAIYALYKEKINKILNDFVVEIGVISMTFATCICHYCNVNHITFWILDGEMIDYLPPIFFTIAIMLLSTKINFKSKIFALVDNISLECYTFHFVMLNLFCNTCLKFRNDYLFLTVYLVVTLFTAYCVNRFCIYLSKKMLKKQ